MDIQATSGRCSVLLVDLETTETWRRLRQEFADAEPERRRELLRERANQSRAADLRMIGRAGLGHVGGDMSVLDILTTLFFAVLRVDPEKPDWPDRDRFVLSKGHTAGALYATLAAAGFFAGRRAGDLRRPAVGAQRPPQPGQGARRGDQHRPARAWPAGRGGHGGGRPARPARHGTCTSCSATANCRRAATGRPR